MKKGILLTAFTAMLLSGCKTPVASTNGTVKSTNGTSLPAESSNSLNGLYHTKHVTGTIKLQNDENKSGVFFYCDDTMYKGYHSLENVKVYKNGELIDIKEIKEETSAVAEFITGIGTEDGNLDFSVGDLYKVSIS